MADSQQVDRPAVVTQAKRNSYLRHVQIHMELLENSLAGDHTGCAIGQGDREEIDRHLFEIWKIACAAKLEVVDPRPGKIESGKVIPLRPRASQIQRPR